MLQSRSILHRCDNSRWLKLRLFQIYRHGFKNQGQASFLGFGSIRKRKWRNPNKKRKQVAQTAFNCILLTRYAVRWPDGQSVKAGANKGAAFTRRIRRSRLKIRTAIFYSAKRKKYLQVARVLV